MPWTLENVINEFAPEITNIDYLNIDVEGLGLSVLESNDWNKHSPSVISIELLSCNDLEHLKQFKEYLLKEMGTPLKQKHPILLFLQALNMARESFDTPILFIIYNRPNFTKGVFECIKQLKPKALYSGRWAFFESAKGSSRLHGSKKYSFQY